MKATGIEVDKLGRIVLPAELRRVLDIETNDSLEIFTEDNKIILRKYQPACIFCGNAVDVVSYKERNVCPACIENLKKRL